MYNMYVHTESNKHKNLIFVGFLKATDDKSRIWIRIRNPVYGFNDRIRLRMSRIQNRNTVVLDVDF
jgi:hypothetical protein